MTTQFVNVKVIANDKKEAKEFQTVIVKQYKEVHVPQGDYSKATRNDYSKACS